MRLDFLTIEEEEICGEFTALPLDGSASAAERQTDSYII